MVTSAIRRRHRGDLSWSLFSSSFFSWRRLIKFAHQRSSPTNTPPPTDLLYLIGLSRAGMTEKESYSANHQPLAAFVNYSAMSLLAWAILVRIFVLAVGAGSLLLRFRLVSALLDVVTLGVSWS